LGKRKKERYIEREREREVTAEQIGPLSG